MNRDDEFCKEFVWFLVCLYVLFVDSCGCFWFVDVFMVMLVGKISWHSSGFHVPLVTSVVGVMPKNLTHCIHAETVPTQKEWDQHGCADLYTFQFGLSQSQVQEGNPINFHMQLILAWGTSECIRNDLPKNYCRFKSPAYRKKKTNKQQPPFSQFCCVFFASPENPSLH